MASKNSIVSNVENSDSNEVEKEQIPSGQGEVEISSVDPSCLRLAPDHPIYTLWRMRSETSSDWLPSPSLRLAAPPGQPDILTVDELKKQLSRLLFTVSSTANKRLISSKEKNNEPDSEEEHSTPDIDAEVVTFVTSGSLTAWFLIYPPIGGGQEVNREMLEQALVENDVSFGINEALLDSLPEDPNRYFHMHLVAQGIPPIHGTDGIIVDLFSRNIRKEAKVSESGKINYMELNLIQNINVGDAICRIVPPSEGEPGTAVSGQEIPQKVGKPATIPQGRNTKLSADGNTLLASLAGRVEYSGKSFQVQPVFEVKGNVDYSTGNINFLGDVDITGDICTGFSVKAIGNVTVGGVVESCRVEAGGNVTIQKGVKGDNHALIHANRCVYAKYLENCSICARELLQSECIINSNVYSDGAVNVDTGRGVIIGGKVRAASTIAAKTIGSKAGSRTVVGVGGMPSAEFEHDCLMHEVRELHSLLNLLEQQPDSPAKLKGLPTVRMKLAAAESKLDQYEEMLENLEHQKYTQQHSGHRIVCDTVHSGTEISIGAASMSVKTDIRYCTAVLIDGEIKTI